MKKMIWIAAALMLLTALLTACGKEQTVQEPPREETPGQTEQTPSAEDTTPPAAEDTTPPVTEEPEQTPLEEPEPTPPEPPAEEKISLDGKKVIFVGNSHTYYGQTVIVRSQSVLTQDKRSHDTGYFYQLCKANGADVEVTNWTWGGHALHHTFGICAANRGCDGKDHSEELVDRYFDYVVIQQGSAGLPDLKADVTRIMDFFRTANPDVKFLFLVQHTAYIDNYEWTSQIDSLRELGVTVVDWGSLVCDILDQKVSVPNAKETYEKNTFIVCKSSTDGYHPNMLTGYITTLMTYCAITGEQAEGQPYAFCTDPSVRSSFDVDKFVKTYYKYNNATTNFPAVFASADDMKGIQQLADQYLAR